MSPRRMLASGVRWLSCLDGSRFVRASQTPRGRFLKLADECFGEEMKRFPDGRMLIWDLARHDGYNIPPYPMAGCGDVKEFLADEGVRNVPQWYEHYLGIGPELYRDIYKYELVMVRNLKMFRKIWVVDSSSIAINGGMGDTPAGLELVRLVIEWGRFALSEKTSQDDASLFKR